MAFFNYGHYYTFPFPRYGPNVFGAGNVGTGDMVFAVEAPNNK